MSWLIMLALALLAVNIAAEPKPARVFSYQFVDETMADSAKQDKILNSQSDGSSGRLFTRKFFNKMFGQKQKPAIIPIIISGVNGDATTNIDTPTSTAITTPTAITTITDPVPVTNTNPVDTATPVVTNTPIDPANPADPADPAAPADTATPVAAPTRRFELYDSNEGAADTAQGGAQDFIVVGQNVRNTFTAAGNRAPARVNLRLRNGRRDQVVTISLPAKYRGYFQNGQRVVLQGNKATHPGKRRVIRRRKNRRRINNNKKNKRRRFVNN